MIARTFAFVRGQLEVFADAIVEGLSLLVALLVVPLAVALWFAMLVAVALGTLYVAVLVVAAAWHHG